MDHGDGRKGLEQFVVADGASEAGVVGGGASIEAEKSGDEVGEPGLLAAVGLGDTAVDRHPRAAGRGQGVVDQIGTVGGETAQGPEPVRDALGRLESGVKVVIWF